jgi:hypothetical protein
MLTIQSLKWCMLLYPTFLSAVSGPDLDTLWSYEDFPECTQSYCLYPLSETELCTGICTCIENVAPPSCGCVNATFIAEVAKCVQKYCASDAEDDYTTALYNCEADGYSLAMSEAEFESFMNSSSNDSGIDIQEMLSLNI